MSLHIAGGCHCGNITYQLDWPADQPQIGRRECGCAFCRKHGAAWTSHGDANLDVKINTPAQVSCYRFGTKTADFHVCASCGVPPFVTCEIDGRTYGIVNVNTFEPTAGVSFTTTATDFAVSSWKSTSVLTLRPARAP